MIKTRFDDSIDLLELIPPGAVIGIIACSDCAAAFKTSDTKRIKQICDLFNGRNEILFKLSSGAPCDQRVFRRLAPGAPGFAQASCYIVLACEAGLRSVSGYISEVKKERGESEFSVISPVRTLSYVTVDSCGGDFNACIFCDECRFESKNGPCPVANCPLHKTDGPCQDRGGDLCGYGGAEGRKCSWL